MKKRKDLTVSHKMSNPVIVVGGGITGIHAAVKLHQAGYQVRIFEKSNHLFGVWRSLVNDYSRLQVDSIVFSIDKHLPIFASNNSDRIFSTPQDICEYYQAYMDEHNLMQHVHFNTEVLSYHVVGPDKKIRVIYREHGEEKECDVFSLWIRTGSLGMPKVVNFPNEHLFQGTNVYGISNQTRDIDFTNKKVVIIGMGAYGIENAIHAIRSGAKQVTLLARSRRFVYSRESIAEMSLQALNLNALLRNSARIHGWQTVMKLAKQAYEEADLMDHYNKTVRKIDGLDHSIWKGVGSSSDDFFLAAKHGLLTIEDGIPVNFSETSITTSEGKQLEVDVMVKCTGFIANDSLLKGKIFVDTMFDIESHGRVNHNIGIEKMHKPVLMGPMANPNSFVLVSYPMFSDIFDVICLKTLQEPKTAVKAWKSSMNGPNYDLNTIDGIDLSSHLGLFWKLLQRKYPYRWAIALVPFFMRARKKLYTYINKQYFTALKVEWKRLDEYYKRLQEEKEQIEL